MRVKGKKKDSGKPRTSLLSSKALLEVSKVMTFGELKYSAHNWRNGFKWSRLLDAALRHLYEYNSGIRIDKESKLSHITHATANLIMLIEHELESIGIDDLWKGHKNVKRSSSKKTTPRRKITRKS